MSQTKKISNDLSASSKKRKIPLAKGRIGKRAVTKEEIEDKPASAIETEAATKPFAAKEIGIKRVNLPKKKLESDSLQEVRSEPTKTMNHPKINLYRKIAISFIVLTVVLISVVFYFSFVKLNIVLIPAQERLSDNLVIDIYGVGIQPTAAEKVLFGVVEQTQIEEANTYLASGAETIGEEVMGKVTIVNHYTKNQPLVATTRLLSSDNKLFRIKNTINVPAGGSQEAEIYADEPKSEMAIGPSKFTIPGLWAGLQDKIYGESKEKFVYGRRTKKYIQQSDIDQGIKDLKRGLLEKAKKEIGETYKGYDKVIYNIDENTISLEVDGKVNEEKEQFIIRMKTTVTIVAFSGDEAGKMARNELLKSIPSEKELIGFNPGEIIYTLKNSDVKQARATINVSLEGKMTLKDDAQIIDRGKIINLTRSQLEDYLGDFEEIAGYEINFFPSFLKKVPNLIDRINIEIKR